MHVLAYTGMDLLMEAIKLAGYESEMKIGMDPASSEFYIDGKYDLDFKNPKNDKSFVKTGMEMIGVYKDLCEK
jgi:enolase